MLKPLVWKFRKHRELLGEGYKHSLLLDILFSGYRQNAFEQWRNHPIKCAKEMGCFFTIETPPQSLREIFVEGIYDIEGFKPDENSVVIDVGASYGDSTIWWANRFNATVIAFEPLESVFRILEKNVKLNKGKIITHNIALGNGGKLTGFSNGAMFIAGENRDDIDFPSISLDQFSFERVDILKIDVEGFELEVLNGARKTILSHNPRIILEVHTSELKKKCHTFLTELGYGLALEGRKIKADFPGMDLVQNLFYSKNS